MARAASPPTLYQQNLVAWYDDTASKPKAGDSAALDIAGLIEELDCAGGLFHLLVCT